MNRVYLNAACYFRQPEISMQPFDYLGQSACVPYYRCFSETVMSDAALYGYLDDLLKHTLAQAGWRELGAETLLLLGSTAYSAAAIEACGAGNEALEKLDLGYIGHYLQQRYGCPVWSFATSCTSSAQALQYAVKCIRSGLCRRVVVLGFELFNRLTFEHFHAMGLLAEAVPKQLFAGEGMVLGENMAALALSSCNADDDAECVAAVAVSDGYSLTNADETAFNCLLDKALLHSGVAAEEIGMVKVHAVGSGSDEWEKAVLQRRLPESTLFAVKPVFGHTLGASGALETAFWQQCRSRGEIDKAVTLSYFLGFGGQHCAFVWK